ncbi:hypothetical protein [Thermomonospora amylolytica]|uniref:hypothetical protein n=1 Tax=Thermomonospora amylolytica TaxID=1411117 RepID=UPI00130033C3|nr:hypothetical protein [Thermomonospora amylolytica]
MTNPPDTPLARKPEAAFELFSWTVVERDGDPPVLGAVGVCDDRRRALRRMVEALADAPGGACGLVHKVSLHPVERGYSYDGLVARAWQDACTGEVMVCEYALLDVVS